MTDQVTEEVKDPQAVLAELRRIHEDFRSLKEAHEALKTEAESLRELQGQIDALKAEAEGAGSMWRERALHAEILRALEAEGFKDSARLQKFVGTEGIDFDEDNNLTGFNERLEALRADLPEVFDAKRRAGGTGDIHANDVAEPKNDLFRQSIHTALNG